MFIDSHCHLESYKNLDEVIQKSKLSLEAIISCGHSIESSMKNIEIAKAYEDFVYPVVGVGPQAAMKMAARNWKIEIPGSAVAVGEIGLDYHWAKTNEERQLQKECFSYFMDIAIQVDLPIVIHSRDSQSDVIKMLEEKKPDSSKVIWHCFSGTVGEAEYAVSKGNFISFIPLPSRTRKEIANLPGIRALTETDAPYIGKFPTDVVKSAEIIADARKEKLEKIEEETKRNAKLAFGID